MSSWLCAATTQLETYADDLQQLQGTWTGTGGGNDCTITIKGSKLRFFGREDFWFETTFTLPPSTFPKQLHATIEKESDAAGKNVGTTVVAVFKIENNVLTLVVIDDYTEKPAPPVENAADWTSLDDDFTKDRFTLKKSIE
ncbi:MAG: hypothetical protein KDC35_18970 [Acidobacteria bacterium]|nr:hypothetical protein [Acidobacteriota bacterium]